MRIIHKCRRQGSGSASPKGHARALASRQNEREIENALIRHITRCLIEPGSGFAYLGRQLRLEVGGDEFFIDLLFYHTRLKCRIVIGSKAGPSSRSTPAS